MVLTWGDLAVAYHESVKHDRLRSFSHCGRSVASAVVRYDTVRKTILSVLRLIASGTPWDALGHIVLFARCTPGTLGYTRVHRGQNSRESQEITAALPTWTDGETWMMEHPPQDDDDDNDDDNNKARNNRSPNSHGVWMLVF